MKNDHDHAWWKIERQKKGSNQMLLDIFNFQLKLKMLLLLEKH